MLGGHFNLLKVTEELWKMFGKQEFVDSNVLETLFDVEEKERFEKMGASKHVKRKLVREWKANYEP